MSRPLHLGGTARYRSESQRPDLWYAHAWTPAFGVQGNLLLDAPGRYNAVGSGSYVWNGNYISFSGGGSFSSPFVIDAANPWSVLCSFRSSYSVSEHHFLRVNSVSSSGLLSFGLTSTGGIRVLLRSLGTSASNIINYSGGQTLNDGNWHTLLFTLDYSKLSVDYAKFYLDGSYLTKILAITDRGAWSFTQPSLIAGDNSFQGDISFLSIDNKFIEENYGRDMTADPLLPFRRKTMISLYVPSGAPPAGNAHNIFHSPIFGKKLVG